MSRGRTRGCYTNLTEAKNTLSQISEYLIGTRFPILDLYCLSQVKGIYSVKCSNQDLRTDLLLEAKSLKDSDQFSNIYINRDLTYIQRQELYARRQSLADRRTESSQRSQSGQAQGPGESVGTAPTPSPGVGPGNGEERPHAPLEN